MDAGNGANVLCELTDSGLSSIDALKEVLLAQWTRPRLL
jgi:hypothetical protein